MSKLDRDESVAPAQAGKTLYQTASRVILTGVAVIIPLVVTIYLLQVTFQFIARALQPIINLLEATGLVTFLERNGLIMLLIELGLYENVFGFISELITVLTLLAIILIVGMLATHPRGERFVNYFDFFIAAIPGIGTVYKSFRRMGDIMLDDEIENFQEVKLVEAIGSDQYVIGFKVGRAPSNITEAIETEEVATMFLPLAPNPVTGGLLTFVPEDRLLDVEMTVEEGVRNIITSGVAGHEERGPQPLEWTREVSMEDVHQFLDRDHEGKMTHPSKSIYVDPEGDLADYSPKGADQTEYEADSRSRSDEEYD